jgi:beta-N-acetylhexosaminidase
MKSFQVTVAYVAAILCLGCSSPDTAGESDWAVRTLSHLSLEQKAAQLVCAEINGSFIADDDPRLQRWISLARDRSIGGFVVYGGTPHSIAILLNKLQSAAEIPILISTDFEGGPGQQVTGASEFPPNMAFAAAGDEDLMYRAARAMAEEGKAMGICKLPLFRKILK